MLREAAKALGLPEEAVDEVLRNRRAAGNMRGSPMLQHVYKHLPRSLRIPRRRLQSSVQARWKPMGPAGRTRSAAAPRAAQAPVPRETARKVLRIKRTSVTSETSL
jgi:hypothetical protein